jgi:glucose/mannose-6-phosphate isomerase
VTLDDVLAYPHQIADALWRIEAAGVPSGAIEVCGVAHGAGELAAAIVGDRAGSAADSEHLVLCASYSGDDEEALECFEDAGRRGARRAVICTAGALAARARAEGVPVIGVPAGFDDPRTAIIYFTVAAVVCTAPSLRAELEAAVPTLEWLLETQDATLDTPSERVLGELILRDLARVRADES